MCVTNILCLQSKNELYLDPYICVVYIDSNLCVSQTCPIFKARNQGVHRSLCICVTQIIRMLTEKCRNQEEIIADLELREQEHQELEAEAELLRQQVTTAR